MNEKTIASPNWSPRPRGLDDVWGVLLHHTATAGDSAIAVAKFFAKPESKVSAHDVVGDDGLVVHCVKPHRAAWHAGPSRLYDWDQDGKLEPWERYANRHTIGIEICNRGDNRDTFPAVQVRTVALLIRRYDRLCPNLKLRSVTDHERTSLSGKIDMQPNFPAAKLFWWIIHPRLDPPKNVYAELPKWAQRQVDEIKK